MPIFYCDRSLHSVAHVTLSIKECSAALIFRTFLEYVLTCNIRFFETLVLNSIYGFSQNNFLLKR